MTQSTSTQPPAPPTAPHRPSRFSALNVVLAVLVLLLVALSVLIAVRGPQTPFVSSVVPAEKPNTQEKQALQYDDVTRAARRWTLAFMDVDYRKMDPRIQAVLDRSTDPFKGQYDQSKVRLKSLVQQNQTVSSGKVLSVGVGKMSADEASVFVAANSTVRNKATKDDTANRYYRLKLTMVRDGDRWRTSNVEFVG